MDLSAAVRWIAVPLLLGVGSGMAWWTWGTWPDAQVDFGRELYVAWRLAEGDALYRDVAWFNGPLSAHANALVFRVFGAGLDRLVFANLAVLALLVAVFHRLLARLADEATATLAAVVLLVVFAFLRIGPVGNYNFAAPYSHEVTHGLALAVCAVAALSAFERTGRATWLLAAGFLAGACFLTKPEIFAAVSAALVAGVMVGRTPGVAFSRPAALGALLASALVPVAAAFSLLCLVLAPGEAARGLLAPWRAAFASGAPDLAFYRNLAGLDEPGGHVLSMLPFAFGALAVLVPAAGLDLLLRARPRTRAVAAGIVFALVAVGLSALGVDWLRALRPLPLFLLGLLAWLVGRRLRGAEPGPSAALVALAVLSLALLAKILLGTWAAHYGFALALPGTLVLVATLFCFVPRALRRAGGSGIVFRAAALALVALFVTGHLRLAADALAGNTHAVGSGPDRFLADGRGADLSQVIDLIERAFPPDATVAVLPEGVMLNYLMRRPNPTPYVNFMPPELLFFGEDAMVAAFDARPPDAVVLWHKDTSEYGLPLFGSDYGLSLWAWLRSHYRVVATFGAAPLRRPSLYGLQVLSRNDAPMPTLPGALPAVDPR